MTLAWRSIVAVCFTACLTGCSGTRPSNLGPTDGRLEACPPSPNCVSTSAEDEEHSVPAIPFEGEAAGALARMRAVIEAEPRTRIVDATDRYLHAEFTSLLVRYVDDVEVYVAPDQQVLQIRSASRIGHSDLGVNRARVERLLEAFRARR